MKSFIRFVVLSVVSLTLLGLMLTLPFSTPALIVFILSILGSVVGLFGSVATVSEAYAELDGRVGTAKDSVVEHICRALDIKMAPYYGHYSVGDIARHLLSTGQDHIEVAIKLPKRWDYQIALPLVKYEVRKYVWAQKKQDAFVQKTKEVKVKL